MYVIYLFFILNFDRSISILFSWTINNKNIVDMSLISYCKGVIHFGLYLVQLYYWGRTSRSQLFLKINIKKLNEVKIINLKCFWWSCGQIIRQRKAPLAKNLYCRTFEFPKQTFPLVHYANRNGTCIYMKTFIAYALHGIYIKFKFFKLYPNLLIPALQILCTYFLFFC